MYGVSFCVEPSEVECMSLLARFGWTTRPEFNEGEYYDERAAAKRQEPRTPRDMYVLGICRDPARYSPKCSSQTLGG